MSKHPPPPKNPPPPPKAPDVKDIKNGNLPTQGKDRDNLLSSIQKGKTLKKVPESEKKEPPPVNPKMENKIKGNSSVPNTKKVETTKKPMETKTSDTKTNFVPTGNPTLDEMQKKRLAKKDETEKKPVPTVPTRREVPTVPKRDETKSTEQTKKELPQVPTRREPPKVPKRDETKEVKIEVKHESEKPRPQVPTRREPPRPPKRDETKPEIKTEVKPEVKTEVKPEIKKEIKPEVKHEIKHEEKPKPPTPKPHPPKEDKPLVPPKEEKPRPPSREDKPTTPKPHPPSKEEKPIKPHPPSKEDKPNTPKPQETVKEEIKHPEIKEPEMNIELDGKFKFQTDLPPVPEIKNIPKIYRGNNPKVYEFLNVKKEDKEEEWENIEPPQRKAPGPPSKPKPQVSDQTKKLL